MHDRTTFRNTLLNHLSADDLDLVRPHLEHQDLPMRRRLSEADRPIDRVYFLEGGIASIVTNIRHRVPIEIGIAGREGMANLAVLLGTDRSPNETFMQIPGSGFAMDADRAREAMRASPSLARTLLQYVHVYMAQTASTVLANGRATVVERLARWLLMAHDRVDGDELALTHELLSVMLGVRRSGVTVALQDLERRGLTIGGRGVVRIVERGGLEETANGYYGSAESELRRIFGRSATD